MIDRYAELVLTLGTVLERDKPMIVTCEPGHEEFTRALAEAAYRRGARYVDISYIDPWVRRSRLLHSEDPSWIPPWLDARWEALIAEGGARLALRGMTAPEASTGVDPVRAGKDRLPLTPALVKAITIDQSIDWAVVPVPAPAWAAACRPATGYDGLWAELAHLMRLDADDPASPARSRWRCSAAWSWRT